MNLSRRSQFFVVLGGMVLFLLGMSGYHQYVRFTGERVVLETRPVDPRSLFRGDYVILNYTINRVDCDKSIRARTRQYVRLEKNDDAWDATDVSTSRPRNLGEGTAVIRGRLINVEAGTCLLHYPSIQSYFVPEGTGQQIQRHTGRGLKVEVALTGDGYPVIRKLIFPD